jgi:hypothetical protein
VNLELGLKKDGDGRQILIPAPDRYKFVSVLRLSWRYKTAGDLTAGPCLQEQSVFELKVCTESIIFVT